MDVKRFLEKVCERPKGFTEVRRDGKDQEAVVNVIRNEIKNCKDRGMPDHVLCKHIQVFASSAWVGILKSLSFFILKNRNDYVELKLI